MIQLKLCLMGFGNSVRTFLEILSQNENQIKKDYGFKIIVTSIITGSKGALYNPTGIHLKKAWKVLKENGHFNKNSSQFSNWTNEEFLLKADYDIMIEATPLEIFTAQPATNHIKLSLTRGKHTITANKGPIAWYFHELSEMAKQNNCCFFYETTVMDGTPLFNLASQTLRYCKVLEINGILNSSTNYILAEMEKGTAYNHIIDTGRKMGFIESNPALDIEGWDAVAKVAALMNVLMDARLTPMDVLRTGIDQITYDDIKKAKAHNKVIKLLCHGHIENGKSIAYVKPVEIEQTKFLATISGTSSAIEITTDYMGKISIVEHDPKLRQTGYGLFSDLIKVLDYLSYNKI